MFKSSKIAIVLMMLLAIACVEPLDITFKSSLKILVVDGLLTNEDVQQKIKIQATVQQEETVYNTEIPNLKVELLVNSKERILLSNEGEGIYALPPTFRAETGNFYQLIFKKPDGTTYESDEQKMPNVIKIDKIYDEFEVNGILKGESKIPANYLYLDFRDPANEQNYYLWTWNLWERQYVCKTEYNTDLYCRENCWEILHNENWNIFSDIYSKGKTIEGKLVAKIPYYQFGGALFEVKQLGISANAFRFLKLINDQIQRTGTLVDTPPAAIVGNVKNITNPDEQISGFFMVASASKEQYWLSRDNASGKAKPIGLLGRGVNPSPFSITYPCIAGPNRTPNKPQGWLN